jgi:hypothetical protein
MKIQTHAALARRVVIAGYARYVRSAVHRPVAELATRHMSGELGAKVQAALAATALRGPAALDLLRSGSQRIRRAGEPGV